MCFLFDTNVSSVFLLPNHVHTILFSDICNDMQFDCGDGFCINPDAECDGFNDCLNNAEEISCGK